MVNLNQSPDWPWTPPSSGSWAQAMRGEGGRGEGEAVRMEERGGPWRLPSSGSWTQVMWVGAGDGGERGGW